LARHRGLRDLHVRIVPGFAARLSRGLPFVATLPARQDQDAVTIGEVVEMLVFQLAFAADRVEAHVADVTELGLHAPGQHTQEHVRRPAAAADQHRLAVEEELDVTLLGELRDPTERSAGDHPVTRSPRANTPTPKDRSSTAPATAS